MEGFFPEMAAPFQILEIIGAVAKLFIGFDENFTELSIALFPPINGEKVREFFVFFLVTFFQQLVQRFVLRHGAFGVVAADHAERIVHARHEKVGAEKMKDEAFALCKAKYEEVYGVPLTYGTKEE